MRDDHSDVAYMSPEQVQQRLGVRRPRWYVTALIRFLWVLALFLLVIVLFHLTVGSLPRL